ncbi:hypothetical protein ACJMK2_021854 [Sinanodonta woodiana]|uniref:Maturase K n=1 Tax=Sinanodonta woodiana TaxID=1069815 RepID=A0ABD3THA4_SINWO
MSLHSWLSFLDKIKSVFSIITDYSTYMAICIDALLEKSKLEQLEVKHFLPYKLPVSPCDLIVRSMTITSTNRRGKCQVKCLHFLHIRLELSILRRFGEAKNEPRNE